MIDNYFKFYASCIPVKGFNSGLIYDLRRGDLYYIPNSILEILEIYSNKKVSEIFKDYENQLDILNKYFNFLIENELIFYTDDLERFPTMNLQFRKPFLIDIVLLEIDNLDFAKMNFFESQEISSIGCTELVLISKEKSTKNLETILLMLEKSKIQTVTYLIDHKDASLDRLNELSSEFLRLREIIVFNTPGELDFETIGNVDFANESLDSLLSRKISGINDLVPNLDAFIESQEHNLFYNRRVYIDNENNVKHSNEEVKVFGNIGKQKLTDIVSSTTFTELWNISKNQIQGCKDCELRYICPDNRIPVMRVDKAEYYHVSECNYNPYTNQWK